MFYRLMLAEGIEHRASFFGYGIKYLYPAKGNATAPVMCFLGGAWMT